MLNQFLIKLFFSVVTENILRNFTAFIFQVNSGFEN